MDRRAFISSTVALAAASGMAEAESESRGEDAREYYDLRLFTFATKASLDRYSAFLSTALLPVIRQSRIGLAGAFTIADKPDSLNIYLLQSHASLAAYAASENHLLEDAQFLRLGSSVLDLPADDPPYAHAESSLMHAFEGWPRLTHPSESANDLPRVFELRTYESHSRKANKKKIEMFNQGESAIFARCGFQPVFFAETLAGPQIPNLTYMVTYPSIEARDGFWKKFGADPEKARLFAIPEYADKLIVSKIHSTFLKPISGSLI